jgi:hypothetical protein
VRFRSRYALRHHGGSRVLTSLHRTRSHFPDSADWLTVCYPNSIFSPASSTGTKKSTCMQLGSSQFS